MSWATIKPSTVWSDMCLGIRIPAAALMVCSIYNTMIFYKAGKCGDGDAQYGVARGTLLELHRLKYSYIAVPRYAVKYEYTIDGKTYVSTRATTGSPYRDWMSRWYNDTITEAQYLQAIPVLRIGERCNIIYDRSNPQAHSAIAHDANSWEMGIMLYLAAFPLLMAGNMKMQAQNWMKAMRRNKMKIRFPKQDRAMSQPTDAKVPAVKNE